MSRYYAGIGSRDTPKEVLLKMERAAKVLTEMGYTLRSGGAEGADSAFERGCVSYLSNADAHSNGKNPQIFLPYQGFRKKHSSDGLPESNGRSHARLFHPNWKALSSRGWDFMARNSYQVLGYNLRQPVEFVICWTPGGRVCGGTCQALRIAEHYRIPILNFGRDSDETISEFILKLDDL